MFTEQQVESAFKAHKESTQEELNTSFKNTMDKQEQTFGFLVANKQQYNLSENTQNATAELLFHIFGLYEQHNFTEALSRESIEKAILDMESKSLNIEKELGGLEEADIEILNKAIESGSADKLTGKPKEILDVVMGVKKEVKQPVLLEYVSSIVTGDNLIIEKDKSIVFSIAETIIDAIQLQAKEAF